MKKFRRVEKDEVIAGVCTGIAQYFEIDVVLVRIAFLFSALLTFIPFLLYIVIIIAAPKELEDQLATYEDGFDDGMIAGKEILAERLREEDRKKNEGNS